MPSEELSVLQRESRFSRNECVFAAEIDQELVMMDEASGYYFGLNPIAKHLWEILAEPHAYAELLTVLTTFYEVDSDQCRADIEPFLQVLLTHKLISCSA